MVSITFHIQYWMCLIISTEQMHKNIEIFYTSWQCCYWKCAVFMKHHTLVWKEQELIQRKEKGQSLPKKSEFRLGEKNISKDGDAGFFEA